MQSEKDKEDFNFAKFFRDHPNLVVFYILLIAGIFYLFANDGIGVDAGPIKVSPRKPEAVKTNPEEERPAPVPPSERNPTEVENHSRNPREFPTPETKPVNAPRSDPNSTGKTYKSAALEKVIYSSLEELNDMIKYAAETDFNDNSEREFFLDRIEKRFEPNAIMEVSSLKNKEPIKYGIRNYFRKLTHLKEHYSNVSFSFSNQRIKELRESNYSKYKYFSKAQFTQTFRGFVQQNEVYADETVKISEIFIYNDNVVKFGKTTIESTREILNQ